MDLSDALDEGSSSGQQVQTGGPVWPGQPTQPSWPGQPTQPSWPGQPTQPSWPGQPGQPSWPGQPGQPSWPTQPGQPGWPGQDFPTAPQQALTVPYCLNLPNGCYDKLLITINGKVNPNAKMFTIDFCQGSDIPLHFNPRFNEDHKQIIVRNSMVRNSWGKEERQCASFPFVQGKPFTMKILCTANDFKVAVDDNHLLEFKHRVRELNTINKVNIYNDLSLTSVQAETLR